ncbi:MAG: FCD domain-containing protein [Acidimicrobiales bacterium]
MRTVSSDRIRDVAEEVLREASRRGLVVGSRLPTERGLSDELRLTRSTVRNAMALLESDGAISREVGRGTFLLREPASEIADFVAGSVGASTFLSDVGPMVVMAARLAFEPRAMLLVAEEATEANFDNADFCLIGCDQADNYDDFERWDLAFHRSLIEATHNSLLLRMYGLIEVARQGDLWGTMKRRGDSNDRRQRACGEHHTIIHALRNRDGRSAQDAMAIHLTSVAVNLRESERS